MRMDWVHHSCHTSYSKCPDIVITNNTFFGGLFEREERNVCARAFLRVSLFYRMFVSWQGTSNHFCWGKNIPKHVNVIEMSFLFFSPNAFRAGHCEPRWKAFLLEARASSRETR